MNIFIQIIVYTFLIFGIIVFIEEIINSISIEKNCKLIIILNDNTDIETFFRGYKNVFASFKNVYIFFDEKTISDKTVIDAFCTKHNDIKILNNQGISNIIHN